MSPMVSGPKLAIWLTAWMALAPGITTAEEPAPHTEATVVPGAAYDSDLGFGFGVVSDVARHHPDFDPFKARMAAQLFLYLGPRPAGGVRVTYQHHYVKLDLPGLLEDRLRLRFVFRYRQQINGGYYGIGNAAPDHRPWEQVDREADPEAWATARRNNEFGFYKPELGAQALLRLRGPLSAYGEVRLWWTWVDVLEQSKLAADLASDDEVIGRLLLGTERHGVLQSTAGLVLDTRDQETAPTRGMLHEVAIRGGPTFEMPGGYGGLHIQTRFYATLMEDWLVVASRLMLDALVGQPPFLELALDVYEETGRLNEAWSVARMRHEQAVSAEDEAAVRAVSERMERFRSLYVVVLVAQDGRRPPRIRYAGPVQDAATRRLLEALDDERGVWVGPGLVGYWLYPGRYEVAGEVRVVEAGSELRAGELDR